LFEAIGNLLDNAIKFTPPGGVIRVYLDSEEARPVISVRDSGPGIAPDQRKSVLQRFYRADEARNVPGSGLGLSLVDAIVRLHGFGFVLDDAAEGGVRARILCWQQRLPG
jgi:signal transduction histidine kinase